MRTTLIEAARDLAAGRTTSRALTEACLARIAAPDGEGAQTFMRTWPDAALDAADESDALRRQGSVASPLSGIPISIKDLFDVAGEVTLAGSTALEGAAPAMRDAPIVARLRAAGAVLIGRTHMVEFAFGAVGTNCHYGTPRNPFERGSQKSVGRVPGGSSSGAAISVTDGMALAAIGTDTGGSVRIPAALCGLTGFKPTASRVPREGAWPLSTTLDSVGPLAHCVADCMLIDAILAGDDPTFSLLAPPIDQLRFGVPEGSLLADLDPEVARAFEHALSAIERAGARLASVVLSEEIEAIAAINAGGGFSAPEAYAWHRKLLAAHGAQYDPRVRVRIEKGAGLAAADYLDLMDRRRALIERADRASAAFTALVLPTVPIVAPRLDQVADDQGYFHCNALLLRNTAPFNFLDRCAVTLPCHAPGAAPVGLMLVGERGGDRALLNAAMAVEAVLDRARKR